MVISDGVWLGPEKRKNMSDQPKYVAHQQQEESAYNVVQEALCPQISPECHMHIITVFDASSASIHAWSSVTSPSGRCCASCGHWAGQISFSNTADLSSAISGRSSLRC